MKKIVLIITTLVMASALFAGETGRAFPAAGGKSFTVQKDGADYISMGFGSWGKGWSYMPWKFTASDQAGKTAVSGAGSNKKDGATLSLDATFEKTNAKALQIETHLSTSRSTELTYAILSMGFDEKTFSQGKIITEFADGTTKETALPMDKEGLGENVTRLTATDNNGEKTVVSFDPACEVASDGSLRIVLAKDQFESGEASELSISIEIPFTLDFYADADAVPFEPGFEEWFTFEPDNHWDADNEIGMSDWLEKPAGKHGRIIKKEDQLIYNNKPIKLWGLNICYSGCAPDKALAERRAKMYANFGINSVRMHKFAAGRGWAGIQSEKSFVEFNPAGLDRFDYQVAQLKEHGIYTKLSPTFGVKIGPDDFDRIPYVNEFGTGLRNQRRSPGPGAVFLSTELQDLQIEQMVNILNHKNPHTGLTYADDPAIAVVELNNEDSILFYNTMTRMQKVPTLRKRASERFCAWLKDRYGNEEALIEAWGPKALNSFANEGFTDESLADGTIVPAGSPWFYDPAQMEGSQAPKKKRLLDTMLFLYEWQNEFYDRYVQAIRDTGYEGEIMASNWQAGRGPAHYYNLHSDARIGLVDRHNYFSGGLASSMLRIPGSGMLSSGLQQVADRPFMLSEWIHVRPNEWGVEGPAILGAYAMGLQGWDISYIFQNSDNGAFSEEIQKNGWFVTDPNVLGVFPAVSRQVLRGDVKESTLNATRYVHIPSLQDGKIDFMDEVKQEHDVKSFNSDKVPGRALAVARCPVEFTDEYQTTPAFDLTPYRKNGGLVSSTDELFWKEGHSKLDGYFTIDTEGTQAVVGFANEEICELGDVTIQPQSRFGAIYVSAAGPDETIASADRILITAIARARNTGMKILGDNKLLDQGKGPIVMEPVKAEITLRREGSPSVTVLDHNGRKTSSKIPVKKGVFTIDGAQTKTCYYLVEY